MDGKFFLPIVQFKGELLEDCFGGRSTEQRTINNMYPVHALVSQKHTTVHASLRL